MRFFKALIHFQLGRWSIYPKLVLLIMLVITPIYALGLYINQSSEANMRKEIGQTIDSKVQFYLSSFETEINRLNRLKYEFISDENLQELSTIPEAMDSYSRQKAIVDLSNKMRFFKSSSPIIEEVKIYVPALGRGIYSSSMKDDIPEDEVDAFRKSIPEGLPITNWKGQLIIGAVYPEASLSPNKFAFVLEIVLSQKALKQSLSSIVAGRNQTKAMLFDTRKRWVLSDVSEAPFTDAVIKGIATNPENLSGQQIMRIEGREFLVAFRYDAPSGIALAIYEPADNILGSLEKYRQWYWLLSLLSSILIVLFSYRIYLMIYKPLKKLIRAFRHVESGELDVKVLHRNRDEFFDLYQQFNAMVVKVKTLIIEGYEQQMRMQRSELKQLQSQINPHFLYNSYYALYRLAENEEIEKISAYSRHLGDYFRYITRNAADEVTLLTEMKHVISYVEIQMLRFSSRMNTILDDIPADCRDVTVPRLILQPIIENAYHHGLENKQTDGIVSVGMERIPSGLLIKVEDNGDDLTDPQLLSLQRELVSSDSIEMTGLLNVHRRLQIFYDRAGGVSLSRSELGGLCVIITIPIREGNGDV